MSFITRKNGQYGVVGIFAKSIVRGKRNSKGHIRVQTENMKLLHELLKKVKETGGTALITVTAPVVGH